MEIAKFKDWALSYPENTRSGEWECDYHDWTLIYSSFSSFLDENSPATVSDEAIQDLIYIIARDNEMEELISNITQRPVWLELLVSSALFSHECDAQWQFAKALSSPTVLLPGADRALLALFESKNEYVSRMALQALGQRRHPEAEALCGRAWDTGHEYQRIMALWVLKEIGSPQLLQYLQAARADGRKYVVQNAQEIEALESGGASASAGRP
jgi:hypothetical protein